MEITKDRLGDILLISISGKLDSNSAEDAQQQIIPEITSGARIIINLKDCTFVSSAGLRTLMMVGKQLTRENGEGIFAQVPESIMEVMEMTGFDTIFISYPTIHEAVAALTGEAS